MTDKYYDYVCDLKKACEMGRVTTYEAANDFLVERFYEEQEALETGS